MVPNSSKELESWMKYQVFTVPKIYDRIDGFFKSFLVSDLMGGKKIHPEVLGLWVQYFDAVSGSWMQYMLYEAKELSGEVLQHALLQHLGYDLGGKLVKDNYMPFAFVGQKEAHKIIDEWDGDKKPIYAPWKKKNKAGVEASCELWLPPQDNIFPFETAVKIWRDYHDSCGHKSWRNVVLNAYGQNTYSQ
jgi:hypothetical protein